MTEMNAYELALNNTLNLERNHHEKAYKELYEFCKQQADRIAELEKEVDELAGYKESYENCHRMCSGYGMN